MESALLLDVAIRALLGGVVWRGHWRLLVVESATILQLFAGKDEALLVRRDTGILR